MEPWQSKAMTNLAVIMTQVLLSSKTLLGMEPQHLLPQVPYQDFIRAMTDELPSLMAELDSDTRNVLLTLARIWSTVVTDTIRSKPAAADWAKERLPKYEAQVMARAKAICEGEEREYWDDLQNVIKPCADLMVEHIHSELAAMKLVEVANKVIKMV